MSRRVVILDTSLLCCWLRVPGREDAGSGAASWNFERVDGEIKKEISGGSTIVLPWATIIETGNHISQAPTRRYETAVLFAEKLKGAARSETPWTAFLDQTDLMGAEQLLLLAEEWPPLARAKISLADVTIKSIASYYAAAGFEVRILTSDEMLRAYEPTRPTKRPRRAL